VAARTLEDVEREDALHELRPGEPPRPGHGCGGRRPLFRSRLGCGRCRVTRR
jgi:hypothetical protein